MNTDPQRAYTVRLRSAPCSDPRPSGTARGARLFPCPQLSLHPSQSDQPPPAAPADLSALTRPSPPLRARPSLRLPPRGPELGPRPAAARGSMCPGAQGPAPRPAPQRAPPLGRARRGGRTLDGSRHRPPPASVDSGHPATHLWTAPSRRAVGSACPHGVLSRKGRAATVPHPGRAEDSRLAHRSPERVCETPKVYNKVCPVAAHRETFVPS